jgi:choline dehydrogenase-like flavoprotein
MKSLPTRVLDHSSYASQAKGKRDTLRWDAEVVVVGTGAGGAVTGAMLAEAGRDVLFVEEGSYQPTSSFSPHATEAIPRLYRDAGASVIVGPPHIFYAEGRCVGGSTVLNGGMTYRPPERVLDEWQALSGGPLGAQALEARFEAVERAISATHQHPTSVGDDSRIMVAGAHKMGWKVETNRRNQDRCVGANSCIFGCPTGAKQSTLVSWMPRAMRAGARALTEVRITGLLLEGGRCVGVRGVAIDPRTRRRSVRVEVRAEATVLACGAVQTPHILLGHRLGKRSGQLGKNFLCHPNAKVGAIYKEPVQGWKGVNQWAQVREFHDEGLIFAENFVPPTVIALSLPVHSGQAWDLMRRYDRMVLSGVLLEDSVTGHIARLPFDHAVPRYSITHADLDRLKRGVKRLARMHREMGAETLLLPFHSMPLLERHESLDRIDTISDRRDLELFTVHQMGTTRMGPDAQRDVVSLDGELHELPGCFVSDGGLFPTAVGVNPQVTIMALATHVAEGVDRRLPALAGRSTGAAAA